jgi:hypothetical protein
MSDDLNADEKNAIKLVVRLAVNASIYFFGLVLLGAGFWRSAIIAASVFAVTLVNIGRQAFIVAAVLIMWAAIAVSLEIIPMPTEWKSAAANMSIGDYKFFKR